MSPPCMGDPELLVLIQDHMVYEWQVYLDTLFEMVVAHMLEICDYSRMPSQVVDIKDIDAASLVKMRESTATAAREKFSFQSYGHRMHTVCEMFNIPTQGSSITELRKHVEIRNVFQHSRGVVRDSDIKKIAGIPFEVRDGQSVTKYTVGKKIVLTIDEVQYLESTIEAFSKDFEVWK